MKSMHTKSTDIITKTMPMENMTIHTKSMEMRSTDTKSMIMLIITTMDMPIIMQMKYLQAGAEKHRINMKNLSSNRR